MNSRIWLVISLVLALALGAASAAGCTKVVTAPAGVAANTVTASGDGTVHAVPDQAVMSFGVTATNTNAKAALNAVSKGAEQITSALEKTGIAKKDVQTQNVSVYPNMSNGKSANPTVTGYTANITVQATVRDIGTLGDVINAANSAGADSIGGPTFTLSDDSADHSKAIDKAYADARKRAEAMAKAAGRTVGGVVSMSEPTVAQGVRYVAAAMDQAAGVNVPISPGQLDVTANVTVVFELK